MTDLPLVMSDQGLVPQAPADLRAQVVAQVAAVQPDYTSNLPGSLIEDVASTSVYALLQCDSSLVDLVNSLTPLSSNPWLLTQQGNLVGVGQAVGTNTAVYLVFSGPPGFVIVQGFVVSDGTYQYIVQDGGIIGTGGTSLPLYAVSPTTGSWAVPAGSVTALASSVPSPTVLTVTNPNTGIPGATAQDEASYRSTVTTAWLASAQGMPRFLRTLLAQVPGVQQRLVSIVQITGGGLKIIVGGGDPYQVAYAIWTALFDVSALTPSVMSVAGITNANPGVVTTTLNHGYTTGQTVTMAGATGLTALNGVSLTATVLSQKTFSIGVDTTNAGTYTGNGVMSPNARNVPVTISDYPDQYLIPFVSPPQQSVALAVTWNTSSSNYVSPVSIAQLAGPALVNYVNGVYAGQPMNLYDLQAVFRKAVKNIVAPSLITRLVFAVSINGIGVAAQSGTGIIAGDPESYFYTTSALVTVTQG